MDMWATSKTTTKKNLSLIPQKIWQLCTFLEKTAYIHYYPKNCPTKLNKKAKLSLKVPFYKNKKKKNFKKNFSQKNKKIQKKFCMSKKKKKKILKKIFQKKQKNQKKILHVKKKKVARKSPKTLNRVKDHLVHYVVKNFYIASNRLADMASLAITSSLILVL